MADDGIALVGLGHPLACAARWAPRPTSRYDDGKAEVWQFVIARRRGLVFVRRPAGTLSLSGLSSGALASASQAIPSPFHR